MDFYGFECRIELPGDSFGAFISGLGGGGQKAYVSKNAPGYENTAQDYIYNRLGVRRAANNTGGTMGGSTPSPTGYAPGGRWGSQDEYNRFGGGSSGSTTTTQNQGTTFDSSKIGAPIDFSSGVTKPANELQAAMWKRYGIDPKNNYFGQDYSDVNKAIENFGKVNPLTETYNSKYNPADLNFANEKLSGLPEIYQKLAYDQGSKVARHEAKGNLDTLKESVGVRRPGLLMKAEQGNQRNLMSTLGDLNSRLQMEAMQDKENLSIQDKNFLMQQQLAQEQQAQKKAAEDYLGYGSRSELEKNNAQLGMAQNQNLYNAAAGKIGMQQGQLGNERQYQDQALQYLLNLFGTSIGSQNQAAANSTAQRGQTLGFLGDAAKGLFALCLPKGTLIETDAGETPVEELVLGDKVKGGTIIATSKTQRPPEHRFYKHTFTNGAVTMSDGHPYFDDLVSKEVAESDSEHTYDILTTEGFYFVNGIKLGSTIEG